MGGENKKKILIIEDEEVLINLISTKLSKAGYEVEQAKDGEEGMAKIKSWRPDLILLDIIMPKVNGYEVLEKMQEERIGIPVIIISNSGQPIEIEKTESLGAADYLVKANFSPQDVLDKVSGYLSGSSRADGGGKPKPAGSAIKAQTNEAVPRLNVKILLVEDDTFLREVCLKKLLNEGYTVYASVDGQEAVDSVGEVKPDLVLLDIILPSKDGFQVLTEIRSHPDSEIASVPVIMLSNLGQEEDVAKAMKLGANDYLIKAHFTTEDIVKKVKQTLDQD